MHHTKRRTEPKRMGDSTVRFSTDLRDTAVGDDSSSSQGAYKLSLYKPKNHFCVDLVGKKATGRGFKPRLAQSSVLVPFGSLGNFRIFKD